MRQNSRAEAEAATEAMGREFAAQAMRLGTGHALVALHESRAPVLAQMAPSPYELIRQDNTETGRPRERRGTAAPAPVGGLPGSANGGGGVGEDVPF